MIKKLSILSMVALIGLAFTLIKNKSQYIPPEGFVPNAQTALKIAEVILEPIYGKEVIDAEKPLKVALSTDSTFWIVSGTLKKGYVGGVPRSNECGWHPAASSVAGSLLQSRVSHS